MAFVLPQLPYEMNALAPYIDQRTIEFHYGKHHKSYVEKLNGLVEGTPFENASLEDIIREGEGAIFNNGAQVWNHSFYWESMGPASGSRPDARLLDAIKDQYGSFDDFVKKFSNAAATLFGSGWTWLVKDEEGRLEILQESNAGNPMRKGLTPLLTCDVWEHAYYLDYQNKRPEYIEAFWKLVNWNKISERY